MKYKVGCQLNYQTQQDTTFIFNICAIDNKSQKIIQEKLEINPSIEVEEYVSPLIVNRYLRAIAAKEKLEIKYEATVEVTYSEENPDSIAEVPPSELPLETLYYLYPSRYCQSDRLMRLAQYEFGNLTPGYTRVALICEWIYKNVTYLSGSTNSQTSAYDTATERAGVCRDFAHLGIAFCRALNIPARFVSAYAYKLNPPDFHACFEAYLGDRWYIFDATRLAPRGGLIRIGTGRDAADVSIATIFGAAQIEKMNVYAECVGEDCPIETEKAISFGF